MFSTFPDGQPGLGLLLLRFGVGITLIWVGVVGFMSPLGDPTMVRDLAAAAAGILLLGGLWTPAAAAFIAIDELWIAFSLSSSPLDGQWIHVHLAVLSAGIAMLGPGAWSIDARLFGRRRFDIGGGTSGRKPSS